MTEEAIESSQEAPENELCLAVKEINFSLISWKTEAMPHFRIRYDINISYCKRHNIDLRAVYSFIHQKLLDYGWVLIDYSHFELYHAPSRQMMAQIGQLKDSVIARFGGPGIWRHLSVHRIIEDYDLLNE